MNDHLREPGGRVRLYVEAPLGERAQVQASEGQAHYLLHVLRARAEDRVSLFNGRDGEWLAHVADVTKRRGCAFVCERQTRVQVDTPDLWLCFAPIKKTPMDYLAQKATELGVRVLQPVITRRTIVSRVNMDRMRANAVEAAEQSDRLNVPEIRELVSLATLLANWAAERSVLFCDEAGEAPPIAEVLYPPLKREGRIAQQSGVGSTANADPHPARLRAPPSAFQGEAMAILTGPEGGFERAEREMIRSKAFVTPVSLGPRILRADTAALAALAVWQALRGDWR